jgi:hypothetical protein
VGNPTRPEKASTMSSAPSRKTMNSLSNRNGLIAEAICVPDRIMREMTNLWQFGFVASTPANAAKN